MIGQERERGGGGTCLVESGLGGVEVDDRPDGVIAVFVLFVARVLGVPLPAQRNVFLLLQFRLKLRLFFRFLLVHFGLTPT